MELYAPAASTGYLPRSKAFSTELAFDGNAWTTLKDTVLSILEGHDKDNPVGFREFTKTGVQDYDVSASLLLLAMNASKPRVVSQFGEGIWLRTEKDA